MLEAPEGGRHDTLLRTAYRAGRLHAGGEICADVARGALALAAFRVGLGQGEVARTIRDGFEVGQQYPATRAGR